MKHRIAIFIGLFLFVFELLVLNEAMMDALRRNDNEAFEKAAKADPEYRPLAYMALDYATKGLTSIEEVMRVAEINR